MGKQSTRENKTIYQICREEAGLTRSEASEKMTAVSDSKIEKFEYEMQEPTPYDIIQMADAYKRPDLCNYYCSHKCEIGHRYVPEVEVSDLSNIILETIASLNEINPLTTRLIQIARDGMIAFIGMLLAISLFCVVIKHQMSFLVIVACLAITLCDTIKNR